MMTAYSAPPVVACCADGGRKYRTGRAQVPFLITANYSRPTQEVDCWHLSRRRLLSARMRSGEVVSLGNDSSEHARRGR